MRHYFLILICILLSWQSGFAQQRSVYTIGILSDIYSPDMESLRQQLKDTIIAVVGQTAAIRFDERFILSGPPELKKIEDNYNDYLQNPDIDIILAFGPVNNYLLMQKKEFPKPVVLFGTINQDFIDLPKNQAVSGVNNLTYLITPESIIDDLNTFAGIYPYKNIGIIVDEFIVDHFPAKAVLYQVFINTAATYTLIPVNALKTFPLEQLENVDAVYLTSGLYFNSLELKKLVAAVNSRKIISFSAIGKHSVDSGVLLTHSSSYQIDRFFRRIALTIEDIVTGKNAKDIPILIDATKKLTFNVETAQQIDFPIRYSQLLSMEIVGDISNFPSDRRYSLPEIIKQVLKKNFALQAEGKNVALARKDLQIAKSNYLPNLSASGQAAYIDPEFAELYSGSYPEFSTSGDITLEQLLFSEESSANITIQEMLHQATKQDFTAAELDTVLDGCIAYFNVLIAKTNFSIADENLRLTRNNFEIAKQNYSAGQSGKADVLRWKSELAQATQNLVTARVTLQQSFSALNEVLANPIDFKIDVEEASLAEGVFETYNYQNIFEVIDNPLLRKKFIKFLVAEAKTNTPELKALDYNIRAAERTSALYLRSRFLPTIALSGQYNYTFSREGKGSHYPTESTPPDGYYNAGLSISLPIFQRNQLNLNRRKSMIQEQQLTLQKESVELALDRNIYDIISSLANQISNIQISKISAEAAKESLELTQISYSSGAVSITSLIDAQQAYIQAQQQQTNATYNYLINIFQLERIIGYFFMFHSEAENHLLEQRFQNFGINKNYEINK
jgi:outer membrane protein TolC/ABC-type uncharacterized transport system substrate-binding protein